MLLCYFVPNDIDVDYHDYQWIPISRRVKIFIGCMQAKRRKSFLTLSGFTNASRQISCRPSISTGLDVKSQAMKGGPYFSFIFLSLLIPLRYSLHPSGGPPRRPEEPPTRPVQSIHPQALQATIPPVEPMQPYQFQMYPAMQGAAPRPQPGWQVTVTPAQTHLHPPSSSSTHMMPRSGPPHTHSSHQFREDTWEGYNPPDDITPPNPPYDYRYRDDHSGWVPGPGPYYEPSVSK